MSVRFKILFEMLRTSKAFYCRPLVAKNHQFVVLFVNYYGKFLQDTGISRGGRKSMSFHNLTYFNGSTLLIFVYLCTGARAGGVSSLCWLCRQSAASAG